MEFEEVMVCMDCLLFVANGDEVDGEHTAAFLRWNKGEGPLSCGDSEQDEEFSVAQCDGCGTRLGGSRHHMYRQLLTNA